MRHLLTNNHLKIKKYLSLPSPSPSFLSGSVYNKNCTNIDLGAFDQESFDTQVFVHAQLLMPIVRIQFKVQ